MSLLTADGHLRGETLLLLQEGELDPADLERAEQHLHGCPLCMERLALARAAEVHLPKAQAPLPAAAAARQRLLTTLQAAGTQRESTTLLRLAEHARSFLQPPMLFRVGAVLALLVVAATFRQVTRPLQELMGAYEDTGPEPDHALTPGSALPMTAREVCQRTDADQDPPVAPDVKRAVFRAYRMSDRTARAYQVDYLINPQLGGDNTLRNLWPEPYHATVWNAVAKDALEARLHGMV